MTGILIFQHVGLPVVRGRYRKQFLRVVYCLFFNLAMAAISGEISPPPLLALRIGTYADDVALWCVGRFTEARAIRTRLQESVTSVFSRLKHSNHARGNRAWDHAKERKSDLLGCKQYRHVYNSQQVWCPVAFSFLHRRQHLFSTTAEDNFLRHACCYFWAASDLDG